MNDRQGLILFQHSIELFAIPNVTVLQWPPSHEFGVAIGKIIKCDWREAFIEKV
jgi:hypothetical protein